MKANFVLPFALGISLSTLSLPLAAHHGNAAYDTTKQVTLKGTVTQWVWANPHCVILFDVTDDSGQLVHWMAETESPTTMTHQRWTRESFKPGDPITLTVITVKNGKPIGRIINVALANGQRLYGVGPSVQPFVDSSKLEDDSKR